MATDTWLAPPPTRAIAEQRFAVCLAADTHFLPSSRGGSAYRISLYPRPGVGARVATAHEESRGRRIHAQDNAIVGLQYSSNTSGRRDGRRTRLRRVEHPFFCNTRASILPAMSPGGFSQNVLDLAGPLVCARPPPHVVPVHTPQRQEIPVAGLGSRPGGRTIKCIALWTPRGAEHGAWRLVEP
ncbi:hypothetical protein PHLGIDRAFT_321681 [Phlebiopsis gigantea 11061_1 CR5-6]|uniref:Uncharacterized protein n=1 Tax=Phlebiopsis gigantea (strain 11061_1 CR5-6) TaxID=745531 RepID=A0A0C3PAP3_PHLG1|nr:hypothetical protein PHLGIDRAFT_321681 [Phlebiopsis gigantea 11061_1 CR5-6]